MLFAASRESPNSPFQASCTGCWPAPSPLDLPTLFDLARSGGAAWVLRAEAAFHEVPFGLGLRSIAATAHWALTRAEDGSEAMSGATRGTNQGRERDASRAVVGSELAAAIALDIAPRLGGAE